MPTVVHDLPAGEKRIEQKSVGFRATLVGGQVIIDDGVPTGARPGRLIRGPLASSAP
jgi:N-acyl-D-aspartate/D-glutamate deacylase